MEKKWKGPDELINTSLLLKLTLFINLLTYLIIQYTARAVESEDFVNPTWYPPLLLAEVQTIDQITATVG